MWTPGLGIRNQQAVRSNSDRGSRLHESIRDLSTSASIGAGLEPARPRLDRDAFFTVILVAVVDLGGTGAAFRMIQNAGNIRLWDSGFGHTRCGRAPQIMSAEIDLERARDLRRCLLGPITHGCPETTK